MVRIAYICMYWNPADLFYGVYMYGSEKYLFRGYGYMGVCIRTHAHVSEHWYIKEFYGRHLVSPFHAVLRYLYPRTCKSFWDNCESQKLAGDQVEGGEADHCTWSDKSMRAHIELSKTLGLGIHRPFAFKLKLELEWNQIVDHRHFSYCLRSFYLIRKFMSYECVVQTQV